MPKKVEVSLKGIGKQIDLAGGQLSAAARKAKSRREKKKLAAKIRKLKKFERGRGALQTHLHGHCANGIKVRDDSNFIRGKCENEGLACSPRCWRRAREDKREVPAECAAGVVLAGRRTDF